MSRLEREVGTPVFDRTTQGVTLTEAERAELAAVFPPDAAAGLRYPEEMMRLVNA